MSGIALGEKKPSLREEGNTINIVTKLTPFNLGGNVYLFTLKKFTICLFSVTLYIYYLY